jgi:hypothetical protein
MVCVSDIPDADIGAMLIPRLRPLARMICRRRREYGREYTTRLWQKKSGGMYSRYCRFCPL